MGPQTGNHKWEGKFWMEKEPPPLMIGELTPLCSSQAPVRPELRLAFVSLAMNLYSTLFSWSSLTPGKVGAGKLMSSCCVLNLENLASV